MSVDAGLFELRPVINTRLALDIKSESKTDGAEALLFERDDSNNQKFMLYATGNNWYVIALHSGKYLATSSTATDGSAVGQWTGADAAYCKWSIVDTGDTLAVDGKTCTVVTLAPLAGTGLRLECSTAHKDGQVRVRTAVATSPERDYQRWALYPSVRYHAQGPAPFEGAMSVDESGKLYSVYDAVETVYPSFRVPSSWLGRNTYSWRWSRRDMGVDGAWGDWTNYTAWSEPTVTTSGDRVWITDGLDGWYEFEACIHRQYYVQVVCQGTYSDGYVYHGPVYGFTIDICKRPTFVFDDPTFYPTGLVLSFGSDYTYGSNRLVITKVGSWTGTYTVENLMDGSYVLLPLEKFGWFAAGSSIDLEWYAGNDQHPIHEKKDSSIIADVSYEGGTLPLSPTVETDEWGIITVSAISGSTVYADSRAWIFTDELIELKGSEGVFTGLAPVDDYTVFVAARDSSTWAVWSHDYTGGTFNRAHLLIADDGTIVAIGMRDNRPLEVQYSLGAIYDASALDARPRKTVRSAPTSDGAFKVEGSIVFEASSPTIMNDLKFLVHQHVIYRSPLGDIDSCFVANLDFNATEEWAKVSISLIEETV